MFSDIILSLSHDVMLTVLENGKISLTYWVGVGFGANSVGKKFVQETLSSKTQENMSVV